MRIRVFSQCLLCLCLVTGLAGCSQTAGLRAGAAPNSSIRTVASVGDRPLPIVAGEPGSSLRAEDDIPDPPAATGSRISGRVYDDRGKPVPNAKVRLAVGGAAGGKVADATTDRSGAFTLHGMCAGSSYTVIAEHQGNDGTRYGCAGQGATD